MPSLKSAVVLSLLPELLAARSIPLVKRRVDCSFSIAASSGDSCESFAASWGISVDDSKLLNPGLDCTRFDDFADYCVMGDVTVDEPSLPCTTTTKEASTVTTSTTTVAHTATTEKTTTTTISTTGTATGGSQLRDIHCALHRLGTATDAPSPTQAGIDANCDKYHKVTSADQCDTIASQYGITHADFSAWNPSIDDKYSNLWLDYYVCVHVAPKPQMAGITSDCMTYHKVQSGEGCWAIDSAYNITLDQFRKWNPTIDASCSNLWVDKYVCVGVGV
ncbi:LysM peptidoglycan-binding domain-containing protein [Aspergillus foveolatus]|uniref:LysM peptidoglycan-binding domain-containing protein n=1 Tax=Aspergillus foveolatus TaxID=210207 RepID=UPI003CCCDDB9